MIITSSALQIPPTKSLSAGFQCYGHFPHQGLLLPLPLRLHVMNIPLGNGFRRHRHVCSRFLQDLYQLLMPPIIVRLV